MYGINDAPKILTALLVVLTSAGCGYDATASEAGRAQQTRSVAAMAVPEVTGETVFPPDGWYLNVTVTSEDKALQLKDAEVVAELAAAAGFSEASVLPNPGLPVTCMGEPCEAVGVEPGLFTTVVLKAVDGPDLTSAGTTWEDLRNFRETVREPEARAAQAAGIAGADVNWLAFSNVQYLKPTP